MKTTRIRRIITKDITGPATMEKKAMTVEAFLLSLRTFPSESRTASYICFMDRVLLCLSSLPLPIMKASLTSFLSLWFSMVSMEEEESYRTLPSGAIMVNLPFLPPIAVISSPVSYR